MSAVWMVLRAEVRSRWRSWLALVLLVAVVGGIVLGGIAAGRRTASAFPRFVRTVRLRLLRLQLPAAAETDLAPGGGLGRPDRVPGERQPAVCVSAPDLGGEFRHHGVPGIESAVGIYKLVSGRLPDPSVARPGAGVVQLRARRRGEGLAARSGCGCTRRPRPMASSSNTASAPQGPTVSLQVVGIEASEPDFPSVGTVSYEVFATPAFARAVNPKAAVFDAYIVRLRHGVRDLPRFDADLQALGGAGTSDRRAVEDNGGRCDPPPGRRMVGAGAPRRDRRSGSCRAGAQPPGWCRDGYVPDAQRARVRLERSDRASASCERFAIGCAGAVGAMLVAFALSPLAPVGEARVAEPEHRPGLRRRRAGPRCRGDRRLRRVAAGLVAGAAGEPEGPRLTRRSLWTRSSPVGEPAGGGRCAAEHADRSAAGARRGTWSQCRAGAVRARRCSPGRGGTVRHGSLRQQPDAPHVQPRRSTGRSSRYGSTAFRTVDAGIARRVGPAPRLRRHRRHPRPAEPRHHRRSGRAHHRGQSDRRVMCWSRW